MVACQAEVELDTENWGVPGQRIQEGGGDWVPRAGAAREVFGAGSKPLSGTQYRYGGFRDSRLPGRSGSERPRGIGGGGERRADALAVVEPPEAVPRDWGVG